MAGSVRSSERDFPSGHLDNRIPARLGKGKSAPRDDGPRGRAGAAGDSGATRYLSKAMGVACPARRLPTYFRKEPL